MIRARARTVEEVFLPPNGYAYAIELIGTQKVDEPYKTAVSHLEGDFPGGIVRPALPARLRAGLIVRLIIEA